MYIYIYLCIVILDKCILYFSWWQQRNFRVPTGSTTMKLATAGKAFGYWNKKDNTFQFKLPPGTCKAEVSFMGVSGIHEFHFSNNTSEASHVSWEDYDYEYQSEAYMLDREFTKRGRHPPIVEKPIPRVENMANFYNPTRPSHFINGSLERKRRVYAPHELRQARGVGMAMGMNHGPAYFTRNRSNSMRRPRSYSRSYSRSPSKTPERKRGRSYSRSPARSYSKSPARSPVRCPNFRSCTRSRSASCSRSRSRSPSYTISSPLHEPYIPVWKQQIARFPDHQRYFIRNIVSRLNGMLSLDKFFQTCGIPRYVWKNAQEDSKLGPANMAEYSAIEQTICIWWISIDAKPLYWKVDQLQAGFEELNLGRFFRGLLQKFPQMDPTYHEIQLDLPGDNQTSSAIGSHPPRNITVEYAEKQMSQAERNFLQMLSTFTNTPECVNEIAIATSLDAAALLTIQSIYHDPKRAEWTTCEYVAYHILITWYASVSKTQTEKICDLRDAYYSMGLAKDFDISLADSKFEIPKMKKGGRSKSTPAMGVAAVGRQSSFSPNSQSSLGPNGEETGKRILDANKGKNNKTAGKEKIIASGEAILENVGTDKNPRVVTFELSQNSEERDSSPPPLISD